MHAGIPGEVLPPPKSTVGPVAWLRTNLFSSIRSSILTIVLAVVIAWATAQIVQWVLFEARWGVITTNLQLFLIGLYTPEEAWRIWLSLLLLSVLTGASGAIFGPAMRTMANWLGAGQLLLAVLMYVSNMGVEASLALALNGVVTWAVLFAGLRWTPPRRPLVIGWILSLPIMWVLLSGTNRVPADQVLPEVSNNLWGGLLLTFVLAIVGIVLSFPFGVLLALGRRSSLPAVRLLSTTYIEVIRGVPLVTILFMADIILPLFLPGEWRIDRVVRAMGGITLFSAAYVAENVRGGLQAIPRGQIEAAQALGLSVFRTNLHIVLPQALRAVIPANVGLFISLLKDTTLVVTISLFEILGIGNRVLAQPEWFGANMEVYVFVGAVFFVLCYTMSQASYRLEASLGVGKR
jgi:general L-amino acid transport system permease protein